MGLKTLIREFKKEYSEKGSKDLKSQVKYLAPLAKYYHDKGEKDSDWMCLLKAHMLYNSVALRDSANKEKWLEQAFKVQQTYWGETVNLVYQQQREITQGIKARLTEVCQTTEDELENIQQNYINFNSDPDTIHLTRQEDEQLYEKFMDKMESASWSSNNNMIEVYKQIISRSIEIVGDPPCGLCVVALGSLARDETTPYSDFELMFLTENNKFASYFARLALTLYFQIGNLQETSLEFMDIRELQGWFPDLSNSDLKVDGLLPKTRKSQTGNGCEDHQNIGTVSEMVIRYLNICEEPPSNNNEWGEEKLIKVLSSTLPLYEHGETNLYTKFRSEISRLGQNKATKEFSKEFLKRHRHILNYFSDPGRARELNIKNTIYQYLSMFIQVHKINHQIEGNPSEVIRSLVDQCILSEFDGRQLRMNYCCALYLRLSKYLHHGSQKSNISSLKSNLDYYTTGDVRYGDQPVLLHMFIHLLPLEHSNNKELKSEQINLAAAIVSAYCRDYQDCYDRLQALPPAVSDGVYIELLLLKVRCTISLGKTNEAEKILQQFVKDQLNSSNRRLLTSAYYHLAVVYMQNDQIEKPHSYIRKVIDTENQLENHGRARSNWSNVDSTNNPETEYRELATIQLSEWIATMNSPTEALLKPYIDGYIYLEQGKYTKAENALIKYLAETHDMCGTFADHRLIVVGHNLLGNIYEKMGRTVDAQESLIKALKMNQRLHDDADNQMTSDLYGLLGRVQCMRCDYKQSVDYLTRSIEMRQRLHQGPDHKGIAECYCYLGLVALRQNQLKQATEYYTLSLAMLQRLHSDPNHSIQAECYFYLGVVNLRQNDMEEAKKNEVAAAPCYFDLGVVVDRQNPYIVEAETNFTKSLEQYQIVYGITDHINIAQCFLNLGLVALKQSQGEKAEKNLTKSLEMYQKLHCDTDHLRIAECYYCLGIEAMRQSKPNINKAKKYYTDSLAMFQRLHRDSCHLIIAECYFQLGLVAITQNEPEKAQENYRKSLEISLNLGNGSNQSMVAACYFNLGGLAEEQNQHDEAEKYFTKSLGIFQQLYDSSASDHIELAECYFRLGSVATEQGQHEKSAQNISKALEIQKRLHCGSDHPDIARCFLALGSVAEKQQNFEKAKENIQKSLDVCQRLNGESDNVSNMKAECCKVLKDIARSQGTFW